MCFYELGVLSSFVLIWNLGFVLCVAIVYSWVCNLIGHGIYYKTGALQRPYTTIIAFFNFFVNFLQHFM